MKKILLGIAMLLVVATAAVLLHRPEVDRFARLHQVTGLLFPPETKMLSWEENRAHLIETRIELSPKDTPPFVQAHRLEKDKVFTNEFSSGWRPSADGKHKVRLTLDIDTGRLEVTVNPAK